MSSWPHIKRFVLYARPHWRAAVVSLVAVTLNAAMFALFWLAIDRLIKPIVQATGRTEGISGQIGLWKTLLGAGGLLAAISLGVFVTGVLNIFLSNRVTQCIIKDLRIDLFAHLHRLSVSYIESHSAGELMSRLTNDVSNLQTLMVGQVIQGIRAFIILVALFVVMSYKSWQLTLVTVVGLPIIAFTIYKASRGIRRISEQILERFGDVSSLLQESLSLMRIIQSFAMEEREIERFREFIDSVYRRTMRSIRIQALLAPFIELLGVCGLIVAMMAGGLFVFRKELTTEGLFSFLLIVPQAAHQFKILSGLQVAFQQSAAAIRRVFEVLDEKPEIRDKPGAVALARLKGEIEFRHVSFSYKTSGEILKDVSFTIRPGQVVALAGTSGAGKTTITNLLLRLYDPTRGAVLVDGRDLRDVTLHSLRQQIGIVPQETMLFSSSIRDNIAFARPEASEEEVREAARQANAEEFIHGLACSYDTLVGDRGAKLSGGQRQRIAIARALLRDPRILIMDEATSSLDSESEALVQEALYRLMENRTTIIIAHRFSTIQHADRILVIDRGRIIEDGSHPQLLARKGLYKRLYDLQSGP